MICGLFIESRPQENSVTYGGGAKLLKVNQGQFWIKWPITDPLTLLAI